MKQMHYRAVARIEEPRGLSQIEFRRLEFVEKTMRRVFDCLRRKVLMDGADAIVYEYMVRMADAQISFDQHKDRARFDQECRAVRDRLAADMRAWREKQVA